jgi:16S rRNA (cytidine1402-2'-O)-methyltransferase
MTKTARVLLAGVLVAASCAIAAAQQAPPARIRGTIEKVDGNTLTVKASSGTVMIKLNDNPRITAMVKAQLADIKPGSFIGVTAMPQPDGSQKAMGLHIFLPAQKGERMKRLEAVKREERTMIFYEAPHKLRQTLSDMLSVFGGERRISLAREITKLNEEVIRTTLSGAVSMYEEKEPRGEYVLVLEGAEEAGDAVEEESSLNSLSPEEHVRKYESDGLSRMDAIKKAARDRGMSKSELYKLLI